MRKSLCLLHVNEIYPEVFGFSHIEANLLGTPVLCCDNGANKEVLLNGLHQLINCKNIYLLKKILLKWQKNGVPYMERSNCYSKQNVVNLWNTALGM